MFWKLLYKHTLQIQFAIAAVKSSEALLTEFITTEQAPLWAR